MIDTVGTGSRSATRDRYIDTLRALALGRVIIYHMFGVAWLSFAFPAMGVMFALGGSLMAGSLDRSPEDAVTNRIRRLLPALWVLGLLLVPAMLWHGWRDHPTWQTLLLWVVPVVQPPGNEWAAPVTEVLWYVVAYLWLVVLSAPLRWLYRRAPLRTTLLPLGALALLGVLPPVAHESVQSTLVDLATFGACWIVGFAHRDGSLRRLSLPLLAVLAVACLGGGAGWAVTHPGDEGLDLNDIPLAQGLYSLGFVLLVMRAAPAMAWLARVRVLDRLVGLLNARAVTVYLWHNVAIAACFMVGDDAFQVWRLDNSAAGAAYLAVALALLLVPVLALGWVEDVAARRRPRLWPWKPQAGRGAGPVPARTRRQTTAVDKALAAPAEGATGASGVAG
ncbi:acyltransferase family protein [Rhizomonospora bruguierae]|uniref:acyltransferase family protein n=1 Tax=Rhizomonospora bruguierae TaxID=1581705 RepID=UPI001BCA8D4B|nr:acyltransferase [Micromonospora sp. NBRC 107566]